MRIALVHMRHAHVGGTERILDELSRRLAERGHDVTIVCRSHVDASHPSVRFHVLTRPVVGSAWRMWAFAQDVERHVARADYERVVGLGRTWSQDVIRASGGSHSTWVEQVRRAEGGSRFGRWTHALKDRLAIAIERRAYAPGAYARVVTNSRLVRDDLARRYSIPASAIDVVPNGVDLARFRPLPASEREALRRALGWGADEIVLLFLGTGYARKGLERMLRAFVEIARNEPRARLAIVGRDSAQRWYERFAAELGISQRARFHGERRDAEKCFGACDLHVLPTWYDSFGFTVLEALACGAPVITTDHAGASELVDRGVHGDVLRADCAPAELAASVLAWCDPARLREAAPRARARAEGFGFDATMGKLISIVEGAARTERAIERSSGAM